MYIEFRIHVISEYAEANFGGGENYMQLHAAK